MGAYANFIYERIDEAALQAETTPAEPGYFHLTDDPDEENFRREVIGWKTVNCDYGFLRFLVTAHGVFVGNPFVERPDGKVIMEGAIFGSDAGPFENIEDYKAFCEDMKPKPR